MPDPNDPRYLDEADVRDELTRVFDVCHGCRRCVELCPSFPTLFEMIDRHDVHDAGRLTPAQQDQVVAECFHCKLCYLNCPYIPGVDELGVDFPRLMSRAVAMRRAHGQPSARQRTATQILGRADLIGKAATRAAPAANRVIAAKPGSPIRRVVAAVTGLTAVRLLPPYARVRFSTWFAKRPRISLGRRQGRVTVFPTCLVEYRETGIGKDLVKVYERNGIECDNTAAGCCGAPWLHSGDIDRFTTAARKNLEILAAEVRAGGDIVVPQPTCAYVLKHDYPVYAGGTDAELVAEHTYDAAEYLMKVHRADDTRLDTHFDGTVHPVITYHASCHLRAQDIGFTSRDLLKLTGARVHLVQQCSGIDGMWGYRAENDGRSVPIAEQLGELIEQADGAIVAGDCHLANTAIAEQTDRVPSHPLQIIARAYGLSERD